MTDQQTVAEPSARTPTKAATVQKLLARSKGATLAELTDATSWQPHTARAFLTGLRKKGKNIVRECRPNGDTCWRIER
ncbi:MAG: DUF3489 domain-containing protein [Sphingopyxis sp.]|jgi:hypothetical protein|uniref:DUF3489 domain-containing protein n=1 Tax=Sphingopyxis sp. TaxID=1908224 RepID=UPI001A448A31|nr:DUF3489 domain-containing protein [Sphingopyxis sp.]MBL9067182.1 DUF3489 domain-containing protein [Sphingopyxis sp.]